MTGASASADRAGGPADLSRDASQPEALIPSAACRNCAGCGWVCENHPDTPWPGLTDFKCCGGAGSPCPVCVPEVDMTIKNDSCHPDDPGQDYIDCPNCAAGRIYSLECDSCGWEEGKPLRDWSHHRRRPAQGTSGSAQDAQRLDPQGAGPVAESDAPETPLSTPLPSGSIER